MYEYKIKYIVVIEDEEGGLVEVVTEDYFDTEETAQEFINDLLADEDYDLS